MRVPFGVFVQELKRELMILLYKDPMTFESIMELELIVDSKLQEFIGFPDRRGMLKDGWLSIDEDQKYKPVEGMIISLREAKEYAANKRWRQSRIR